MKIKLPTIFVAVSGFTLSLGVYLLATKTSLHPQFFIITCGEVLKNVWQHTYFNPDGVVSSLLLLLAFIGVALALRQLIRFLIAHRRLHQLKTIGGTPDNLLWVINKHDITQKTILILDESKLRAYTIGLIKPKIVVSRLLIQKLSREQLEAVILHELCHLQNRHILWLLFSRLISSLFFFVPLIAYLARELRTEFELTADAFVVEKQKTRDHLCGSLALNLQHAGSATPHFATTPIEKRVESLVGDSHSFELIGMKPLVLSIVSLGLMLGIAFVQPNQVVANFAFKPGAVCSLKNGCQSTDCSGHEAKETYSFTPLVPTSFSLLSSH